MPDPVSLLRPFGASAAVAAIVVLLVAWPWRASNPARRSLGEVLGVAAAIYLGAWMLGCKLDWPSSAKAGFLSTLLSVVTKTAEARFFFILLPAAILVELVGTLPKAPHWLTWALRLAIAAGAARVLLHDSRYLEDRAGTGSPDWSPMVAAAWLGGLAVALRAVWLSLTGWNRRVAEPWAAAALALTAAAATVAAMLSAYGSASTLGLPLAGAMGGVAVAGLIVVRSPGADGAIGVGTVGLFGLLVIGHFFASLTILHAGVLLLAPALYWLAAIPSSDKFRPWLRGVVAVAMTALAVGSVVLHARHEFGKESAASSSSPDESPEDPYQ